MTAYDVEQGLREVAHARQNPDKVTRQTANLAAIFADGFRRDHGTTMDMEAVGAALTITAAQMGSIVRIREIPTVVLVNMLAFAGEDLVRTARAAQPVVDEQPTGDELANPAADLVVDFLSLVDVAVTAEQAAGWTREQRGQAARWAAACHLSASDNDDVDVPPRPAFLDEGGA